MTINKFQGKTQEEAIAKAKEEGDVESVGMPDSWANWGLTWQDLNDKYGRGCFVRLRIQHLK